MADEQTCPICSAVVAPSVRYPTHVCLRCWGKAVDENGRAVEFAYSETAGYCIRDAETKQPQQHGICFIEGTRCWAGEDYWGGSVICYPYEGESR
jgi:hypothetical protein